MAGAARSRPPSRSLPPETPRTPGLQVRKGVPPAWHLAESTRTVASAAYVDAISLKTCHHRPTQTTPIIEAVATIMWLPPFTGATMLDAVLPFAPALLLLAYPIYLLLMAAVLAMCGVTRKDIAKWALKQADRQRITDLIRAARGLPAPAADGELTTSEPPSDSRPSIEP